MKKERIVYFDYLRIIAMMAVMMLHVAAQNWDKVAPTSLEWMAFNFYDSIVRFGVPVFVMISGALFLSREIDSKTLFSKYILRLVVAYVAWSVFYAFVSPLADLILTGEFTFSYKMIIRKMIIGSVHMWFIPMIIGMYMCVPVIKKITEDRKVMDYFLILSFVFTFVIPFLVNVCNDFVGGLFAGGVNTIYELVKNMKLNFVTGFTFYFVLGYRLSMIDFSKKARMTIYCFGIVGFLLTIILSQILAWKVQKASSTYYNNFSLNIALETVAVFVFFKEKPYTCEAINTKVASLAKYSFGAYLVHIFILSALSTVGINTMLFSPVFSVPAISAVLIVLSFFASFVLNRIPFVQRWFV